MISYGDDILWPKISIVTPSYNQGQYIEETILSVINQNYPNLEYIVIDGGSTDGSVEIIRKYEKYFKYWISEKDNGQVNAINKGLKHCTGTIFNWLNSDDYLTDGALKKIACAFIDSRSDSVAGSVNNFSIIKNDIVQNQNLSAIGLMQWHKDVQFVQPGVWLKRESFIASGGIDEQLHYSFDWDLLIRYLLLYPKVKYINDTLVNFRLHNESKTVSFNERFVKEEKIIIERLFNDSKFKALHSACKWKMDRTYWTSFLAQQLNNKNKTKFKRLIKILFNITKQPIDIKTFRMTLGAIKKIFFS